MSDITELFGDVIYAYTRADALEDGALVDVSSTAAEAGFKFPTAMTRAAFVEFVEWDNEKEKTYQDESGRLWDVCYMAMMGARAGGGGSEIRFKFYSVPSGRTKAVECELKAVVGPGDSGEPVITIMLPHED